MELKGKVALITGASRGIGAATARLLAARGASVGVNYVTRPDLAEKVVAEIRLGGGRAIALEADVADKSQVHDMVQRVVAEFGRLDALVNNAGGPAHGTIETVTEETWRSAIAVHLDGPFYCTRAAIPHMKRNGEGAIVNLSSVAGIRGCPGSVAYQTVKCGIQAFTRGCARDLADFNIRVNCVSPGIIRTDFHARMTEEQKKFNLEKRVPLHREGRPDQIAEVILMLITNDYITGESFVVDGGLTMRIA
jgi:NAD(P)-dependent dehydrogenase (short-subunit alcohol dehydrogenase family)